MARSGFRGSSSILLVVALAVMAGFFYWLYNQSQSLEQEVTPTMTDTTGGGGPSPITVAFLGMHPDSAPGRSATLDSVKVASRLGRGVFTLSVNDTTVYPVLLGSQLIQKGTTVYQDDRINVGGQFYALNDSIRSEWVKRGAVDSASAGDIPATPSFLLADTVGILRSDNG